MENSDFKRIKQKMLSIDIKRYWGDDFDVRYYLISRLLMMSNKTVLDLGGGIGVISSEMGNNNTIINLDTSLIDLKLCKKEICGNINAVCGSMTTLPLQKNLFDIVICAHLVEEAKKSDILNGLVRVVNGINEYPTLEKTLSEIRNVLKNNGVLFLTTPNNLYYQSTKLEYAELEHSLKNHFPKFSINLFNTYPKLSKKNRKLNLANTIPKIKLKFMSKQQVLDSLIKSIDNNKKNSVSFYVEAIKA